jgi:hypothetical protein
MARAGAICPFGIIEYIDGDHARVIGADQKMTLILISDLGPIRHVEPVPHPVVRKVFINTGWAALVRLWECPALFDAYPFVFDSGQDIVTIDKCIPKYGYLSSCGKWFISGHLYASDCICVNPGVFYACMPGDYVYHQRRKVRIESIRIRFRTLPAWSAKITGFDYEINLGSALKYPSSGQLYKYQDGLLRAPDRPNVRVEITDKDIVLTAIE